MGLFGVREDHCRGALSKMHSGRKNEELHSLKPLSQGFREPKMVHFGHSGGPCRTFNF